MCSFYYPFSSSSADRCRHLVAHSSKNLNLYSVIVLLSQTYCWIVKNTNKNFNCVMVLIIRPSSTLQVSMNASEQSFLYQVFKISSYIFWMCLPMLFPYLLFKQMTFNFASQIIWSHLLPIYMNRKLERKGHQIYYKMSRKIHKKDVSRFHHSHQKFIFWLTFYKYMVQIFVKVLCWWFLVPRLERVLGSSATLSCKTWNICLVWNHFSSTKGFSLMVCSVHHQGFKCF